MRTLVLFAFLLLAACGGNESSNSSEPAPAPVGDPNTAGINTNVLKLVDSVASWNPEKSTLAVAFATWEMTDEEREKVIDTKSEFVLNPPDKPHIKIEFELEDAAKGLSPDNVTNWYVVYRNFDDNGPMTMGIFSDSVLAELSGELKTGSEVKVKLSKDDHWDFTEPHRTYRCNVDSTATLLWAE